MKKSIILLYIILFSLNIQAQNPFQIKYGPYLQNVGKNDATMVWVTSKNAVAWVEIAPDDGSHFYAKS